MGIPRKKQAVLENSTGVFGGISNFLTIK